MSEAESKEIIMKPILTDERLSNHSLEKQVALLKAERNMYLSILNVGEYHFSGVVKAGLMAQGVAAIGMIIRSKEVGND